MIGYVSVGTNDWNRALAFYDALMGELGAKRVMDFGTFVAWSPGNGQARLCARPSRTTRSPRRSATARWSLSRSTSLNR